MSVSRTKRVRTTTADESQKQGMKTIIMLFDNGNLCAMLHHDIIIYASVTSDEEGYNLSIGIKDRKGDTLLFRGLKKEDIEDFFKQMDSAGEIYPTSTTVHTPINPHTTNVYINFRNIRMVYMGYDEAWYFHADSLEEHEHVDSFEGILQEHINSLIPQIKAINGQ